LDTSRQQIPSQTFHTGITHICSELNLPFIVKEESLKLATLLQPEIAAGTDSVKVPESVANAVACAIVSLTHEELWKRHRVTRHLPDRIIGRLYGLSSAAVVYNKHLIGTVILKKKLAKSTRNKGSDSGLSNRN